MNYDIKTVVDQLNSLSDENKIRYMLEHQDEIDMVLMLDNDDTYITFPGYEDEYVSFDEYIGNAYGISSVLDVLGIKYEDV